MVNGQITWPWSMATISWNFSWPMVRKHDYGHKFPGILPFTNGLKMFDHVRVHDTLKFSQWLINLTMATDP